MFLHPKGDIVPLHGINVFSLSLRWRDFVYFPFSNPFSITVSAFPSLFLFCLGYKIVVWVELSL